MPGGKRDWHHSITLYYPQSQFQLMEAGQCGKIMHKTLIFTIRGEELKTPQAVPVPTQNVL
jgi:hypothetical protein